MYLIGGESGRHILFDCGWQDSFTVIKATLRGCGIGFEQVAGVFVSHFHPDHAGCLELLRRYGITPLILERQVPYIEWLNGFFKQRKNDPRGDYAPLDASGMTLVTLEQARVLLVDCDIGGEILYTPGHSDDSITLIEDGKAFTGGLPPYETADSDQTVASSWQTILSRSVTWVYPAHGAEYEVK
jgi:glyoxylase-like metal-dependent hydrolase (beta-lactamase superfamily II)